MSKRQAVYDADNFRFIITPYEEGDSVTPGALLRIIHKWVEQRSKYNLRWMADFLGLNKATDAFKATYAKAYCPRNHPELEDLVAIDVDKHEVYFYHHEHKPANASKQHVGPTIANKEDELQNVIAGIPAKISTRVTIVDSVSRMLTMTLKPTGGYVLGLQDINLCQPNMTYQVVGSAKTLNNLLKNIHFVGTEAGNGVLSIAVDDGAGETTSKFTTDVRVKIAEGATVAVASVKLPESAKATIGEFVKFDAIEIEDEDGRPCELRMTPFGCNITGFKNFLGTLVPGKVRKMVGRPETINADIANLEVKALQENAQLGMEFISGTTRQLLYLVFDVTDEAPVEESGEELAPEPTPTPTTEPEQQQEVADTEMILSAPEAVEGVQGGEDVAVAISFSGTRTTKSVVELIGEGVEFVGTATSGIYTDTISLENAPTTLNNKLADLRIRITQPSGSIVINYVGDNGADRTVTIPVTGNPAEAAGGAGTDTSGD